MPCPARLTSFPSSASHIASCVDATLLGLSAPAGRPLRGRPGAARPALIGRAETSRYCELSLALFQVDAPKLMSLARALASCLFIILYFKSHAFWLHHCNCSSLFSRAGSATLRQQRAPGAPPSHFAATTRASGRMVFARPLGAERAPVPLVVVRASRLVGVGSCRHRS